MAISTYDELKTALASWSERVGDTGFVSSLDDFITLAESRINRTLRIREKVIDTTLTGTVSSRELTLPSDYVEPVYLHLIDGTDRVELKGETPNSMTYYPDTTKPGRWCINGDAIDLDTLCDSAYSFVFRYRQKLALSDSSQTNWLLTNHPDVYLYGALMEASVKYPNPEFGGAMNQRFMQAIEEVGNIEARNMATLSIDDALRTRRNHYDGSF